MNAWKTLVMISISISDTEPKRIANEIFAIFYRTLAEYNTEQTKTETAQAHVRWKIKMIDVFHRTRRKGDYIERWKEEPKFFRREVRRTKSRNVRRRIARSDEKFDEKVRRQFEDKPLRVILA